MIYPYNVCTKSLYNLHIHDNVTHRILASFCEDRVVSSIKFNRKSYSESVSTVGIALRFPIASVLLEGEVPSFDRNTTKRVWRIGYDLEVYAFEQPKPCTTTLGLRAASAARSGNYFLFQRLFPFGKLLPRWEMGSVPPPSILLVVKTLPTPFFTVTILFWLEFALKLEVLMNALSYTIVLYLIITMNNLK